MFHQANVHPEDANLKQLSGYVSYLNSYEFLRGSAELGRYRAILINIYKLRNEAINKPEDDQ
jgi:hypothetical protein